MSSDDHVILVSDDDQIFSLYPSLGIPNISSLNISDDTDFYNTSGSMNCDESFLQQPLSSSYFRALVYFLYCSIFLIAVVGNGLVCFIVQRSPRMRTVTNLFIVNLAVGDILMSVFCIPFTFVSMLILHHWPFGMIMCHLVNFSQAVSVLVSAYTLVAISVDRYMAIMWPLKPRLTKRSAKAIIVLVWAIAFLTALPIPAVSKLSQPDGWHRECKKVICREEWPSERHSYYYSMALMGLQFVAPLAVLMFTYTRIAVAVWGKRPPGEAMDSRDQRMARSKRKMVKMMLTVVVVFSVCWLPFNILMVIWTNDESLSGWAPLPYMWFFSHWLAMSHSCYNPIIYCYMNARFRDGFAILLSPLPCIGKFFRGRRRAGTENGGGTSASVGDNRYGHPMFGLEHEHTGLRRMNTCSTYISVKRKSSPARCRCSLLNGVNSNQPLSAMMVQAQLSSGPMQIVRTNSLRPREVIAPNGNSYENKLEAFSEDQI